jgi:hypothetical protein
LGIDRVSPEPVRVQVASNGAVLRSESMHDRVGRLA